MHKNPITCLAYDEMGRLYSGGYDGRVVAFEADARTPRWSVRHEGLVNAVDVGPKIVVSAGADRLARLWDRETGDALGIPVGPRSDDINVAFLTPAEDRVILAGDEGRLSCYNIASRALCWERYCAPPDRYGESIEAAACLRTPDNMILYFAADNSGRFMILEENGTVLQRGRLADDPEGERGDVECAAADPWRQQFVIGTAGGWISGIALGKERPVWSRKVHGSAVKAIATCEDAMICTSYDNRIFSVPIGDGGTQRSTHLAGGGRRGWSRKLAVHPLDNATVACTSLGETPQIWDSSGLDLRMDDGGPTRGINAVCCLRSRIIAGCDSGELWVSDKTQSAVLCNLDSMVLGLATPGTGFVLGAATHDGTYSLVEVGTGQLVARTARLGDPAVCCAFSPDGKIAAVGHYSGVIRLLDATSLSQIGELMCADTVKSVAFIAPDRLAAGIANGSLELWDLVDQELVQRRTGLFLTNSVSFSPTTNLLYTVGRDCLLRCWDRELELCGTWPRHTRSIKVVAVSPDGQWICTTGYDSIIGFQHIDGEVREFSGHDWPGVPALEWIDSDHVVSGGWDGTLRIWSPVHGEVSSTVLGKETVACVS